MGRTPRRKGTYYDRTAEERRAYQRAYYAENKDTLKRQRDLSRILNPEAAAKQRAYQRAWYERQKAAKRAAKNEAPPDNSIGGESQ
jgi:hypothetical protein